MPKLSLSATSLLLNFILCLFFTKATAQYRLRVIPIDRDSGYVQQLKLQQTFKSREQLDKYVDQLPLTLQLKGYAAASIDSIQVDSAATSLHLYLGDIYAWDSLKISSIDKKVLEAEMVLPSKKAMTLKQYEQVRERMIENLANRGYPFAKIFIDSIEITRQSKLKGVLKIEPGPLYKIDSLRLYGNVRISNEFLQQYLEIPNGSIYQTDKLERISKRIRELPYVQEQQPWSLSMLGTGSVLNLYLQQKKSSQINVLVGFLPSNEQSGKLLVTGEANINLKNAMGNGESLGLNWQQLQQRSPRLNLSYQQPYLFKTPFGINTAFDLYKKDSSYVNINLLLGVQYSVSSFQSASVFFQNQKTNLLTIDTNQVLATKRLPDMADVSTLNLGVRYELNKTDYKFNPRTGNEITLNFSAGTRTIKKNPAILRLYDPGSPNFKYASLYDSVQTKTYQFRVRVDAAHYFKLTKASTFKTAIQGGIVQSPTIFRNELLQIGGYKLLRGFDEESIFVSQFVVFTAEYRYLVGLNSFLFVFTDAAWTRNTQPHPSLNNNFIGSGLGLAFETKAGVFNISFAAGKRNDTPFNLRQSKIHLGYVTFF